MGCRKLAGVKRLSRSGGTPRKFLTIPGSDPLLPKNPVSCGLSLSRAKGRKGQTCNKKRYYPFHLISIGKKAKKVTIIFFKLKYWRIRRK
jgi:hypothetical protein